MPKNTMFSFTSIPRNIKDLSVMPEYEMRDPFARAALTVLVLCQYSTSPEDTVEMLNLLAGPAPLTLVDVEEMKQQLVGREYIPQSYFVGATPENGYEPSLPLLIAVRDTTFSYKKTGYAALYVQSSGDETPRLIQLRKKESTGEWFLWGHKLLEPIKEPLRYDPYK